MKITFVLRIAVALLCFAPPAYASERAGGYAGLEFLGSSQISRLELDKILRLHTGMTRETAEKSLQRLKLELDKKALHANVDLIPDGSNFYISVDIIDNALSTASNRLLSDPQHINLPNEKPFALLEELRARMQKLADEGRPTAESYQDGIRVFSDIACMRTAELLKQELHGELPYLYKVLASDPNNERRANAAELLNWTSDPVNNCLVLIPALEDSDARVRMASAKYIWARTNLLPDEFPFDTLLEALSKQLSRPSYYDRIRALSALIALATRDQDCITGIKTFDQAKLQEIVTNSLIPSIQSEAKQLLAVCANPPQLKHTKGHSSDGSSSGF